MFRRRQDKLYLLEAIPSCASLTTSTLAVNAVIVPATDTSVANAADLTQAAVETRFAGALVDSCNSRPHGVGLRPVYTK